MTRTRQGHIQQAQVFTQAFFFKLGLGLVGDVQHQLALTRCIGQVKMFLFFGVEPFEARGKRQTHHGVLEAFAGVNGDDLHQIGIAFQAHHLVVRLGGVFGNLVEQPTDQGLLTFQIAAGVLQQLGQV